MNGERITAITRRIFFKKSATGIGAVALASVLNEDLFAADTVPSVVNPMAPKAPHFVSKAKNIIYLHMEGAPSQLELFDYKPMLQQLNESPIPEEFTRGERFAFIKGVPRLLGTRYKFPRSGKSGQEISTLFPHLATVADDICIIKSLHTDEFNHGPAEIFLMTGGNLQQNRPSMGSWITYGIGSENQDLPSFVVLVSGDSNPSGGSALWGSGFLPTLYQGVEFRSKGDPVLFVSDPPGMERVSRRRSLDALRKLNENHYNAVQDPEIMTRIAAYEMAFRMQTSVPELSDISSEPPEIHEMYGTEPGKKSYANNCLLARRLVERGVRFVQLYHGNWDSHGTQEKSDIFLAGGLPRLCRETDRATTALIKDLKQRGLLDETLVIWGGEFGRTPMNEARDGSKFLGRDHHPKAFTIWMAGGGIKPGISYGSTDELGYNVAENPVHIHDLQATILHCLGLDHKKLTYRFQGRDFRLTDVAGNVVQGILA